MKKALYVLFAAIVLTGVSPCATVKADTATTVLSRADYRQGGYDATEALNNDPSQQNRYNLALYAKANYDEALSYGDTASIDYWQGWIDAIGPVAVPW